MYSIVLFPSVYVSTFILGLGRHQTSVMTRGKHKVLATLQGQAVVAMLHKLLCLQILI